MDNQQKRFFIALLPPLTVRKKIHESNSEMLIDLSKTAQKSPPHITLQPPFEWKVKNLPQLQEFLTSFARNHAPFSIILDGFGTFELSVIYIKVIVTPELLALQQQLKENLKNSLNIVPSISYPFKPHITIAFKNLEQSEFHQVWGILKNKPFQTKFTVSQVTLLIRNESKWKIFQHFPFQVIPNTDLT